jgi:HlyD family secretion protein
MASGAPPSPPKRRAIPRVLVAVLVGLALLGWQGWRWYQQRLIAGRLFASGSIEATQVDVSPKVPGRVIRLLVKEGDQVKAGQVLAEMEGQESRAQVAQAQAQVVAAEARVPQSETTLAWQDQTVREAIAVALAQLDTAQAQVVSARSALVRARDDLRRAKELFAQGAVAAQQVDAAQAAYDAAIAQDRSAEDAVTQARATLAQARANQLQVPIRRQDVEAARAALAQARANLRYLEVLAGHNTITAPTDGIVLTKNMEAGEVVGAGAAIYTLINPHDIWLRVFIPEDQVGRVRIGQESRVSVDAFPHRVFTGHVTEISSQAEFTPGNVQTKEDRVKLVFGVKIQVDNRGDRLKPGMPADAEILVGGPEDQATR